MSYDKILEAMTFGLFFKATDDNGNMAAPDIKFYEMLSSDFEGTIMRICGINNNLYKEIYNKYKILSN